MMQNGGQTDFPGVADQLHADSQTDWQTGRVDIQTFFAESAQNLTQTGQIPHILKNLKLVCITLNPQGKGEQTLGQGKNY